MEFLVWLGKISLKMVVKTGFLLVLHLKIEQLHLSSISTIVVWRRGCLGSEKVAYSMRNRINHHAEWDQSYTNSAVLTSPPPPHSHIPTFKFCPCAIGNIFKYSTNHMTYVPTVDLLPLPTLRKQKYGHPLPVLLSIFFYMKPININHLKGVTIAVSVIKSDC